MRPGSVPAADREGFIHNQTFAELQDVIRGGVELIAVADRELLEALEEEKRAEKACAVERKRRERSSRRSKATLHCDGKTSRN